MILINRVNQVTTLKNINHLVIIHQNDSIMIHEIIGN